MTTAFVMLGSAVVAAPAQAAQVTVREGLLRYQADPGENNDLRILWSGDDSVRVRETVEVRAGEGCVLAPDTATLPDVQVEVWCRGVTAGMSVTLDDGDDVVSVDPPPQVGTVLDAGPGSDFGNINGATADTMRGGPGNDRLIGGEGPDLLEGGEGADLLVGDFLSHEEEPGTWFEPSSGQQGNDTLAGGSGDDRVIPGGGADRIRGGPGVDLADYAGRSAPVIVQLGGGPLSGEVGESDDVGADIESVVTGRAADTVRGTAAAEAFSTGAGDDSVDPGAGVDSVDTGAGADRIVADDGERDHVTCGSDSDAISADGLDGLVGCEVVTIASQSPPRVAERTEHLSLRAVAKRSRVVLTGRLRPTLAFRSCKGRAVWVRVWIADARRTVSRRLREDCRFVAKISYSRRGDQRRLRAIAWVRNDFGDSIKSRVVRFRLRG